MKKIIMIVIVAIVFGIAGFLKATSKSRVYELENAVVRLSESERKAWQTIEAINRALAKLERQAAPKRKSMHIYMEEDEDEAFAGHVPVPYKK